MDVSRVHHVKSQSMKKDRRKTVSINKKAVKVVYVATPVKLNICASNFRALVQQLTGRESDLSRLEDFGDFNAAAADDSISHGHATVSNNEEEDVTRPVIHEFQPVAAMAEDSSLYHEYSPSSSESVLDSFDDVVSSQIVEELEQMFPSNLFAYESLLGDVYGVV